jgi:hypothetical protein
MYQLLIELYNIYLNTKKKKKQKKTDIKKKNKKITKTTKN